MKKRNREWTKKICRAARVAVMIATIINGCETIRHAVPPPGKQPVRQELSEKTPSEIARERLIHRASRTESESTAN